MRPPRWLVIDPPAKGYPSEDGKSVTFNVRVRTWHPGFWLHVIKMWWRDR